MPINSSNDYEVRSQDMIDEDKRYHATELQKRLLELAARYPAIELRQRLLEIAAHNSADTPHPDKDAENKRLLQRLALQGGNHESRLFDSSPPPTFSSAQ